MMQDAEFAQRAYALAHKYADRMPPEAAPDLRDFAEGGVWDQLVQLLVTVLAGTQQPITPSERDELAALLEAMGEPTDGLDGLNVTDQA